MTPFRARHSSPPPGLSPNAARLVALGAVLAILTVLIASDNLTFSARVGSHGNGEAADDPGLTATSPAAPAAASAAGAGPGGGATATRPEGGATTMTAPAGTTGGGVAVGSTPAAGGTSSPPAGGGAGPPQDSGAPGAPEAASPGAAAPESAPPETAVPEPAAPEPAVPEAAATDDPCAGVLSATDQGVTDTTIKIGYLHVNSGYAEKLERIIVAWVAQINSEGGICGRMVEHVTEVSTFSDDAAQIASCKRLALDEKVFAVIAVTSFNTEAGQMCLAKDNKIPIINFDPLPDDLYPEAAPYLWTMGPAQSRMLKNFVRTLVENNLVDPGQNRVGLVYEGNPQDTKAVEGAMLGEMERLGITPVSVFKASPDLAIQVGQMSQAVLQMRSGQVDYVLFVLNVFPKGQFLSEANNQQYFPQYADSDVKDGSAEMLHDFVQPYPNAAYDKTLVVTTRYTGAFPDNDGVWGEWQGSPWAQYADSVYESWIPGGYENDKPRTQQEEDLGFGVNAQKWINYHVGTEITLWAEASRRVGVNLTREAWGTEMGRTGRFDKTAFSPHLEFHADKWDGPDLLAVAQFHAEASNGYKARRFQQTIPYFPPYY